LIQLNGKLRKAVEDKDLFGDPILKNVLLREKFMEPPFSILDTKGGGWQNRKRQWKTLGIQSEIGRSGKLLAGGSGNTEEQDQKMSDKYGRKIKNGSGIFDNATSIFDPALCELMYYWFCPDGGKILDPFSGGSVRGIVANYLGFKYSGVDIRQEQIDSNREQALAILEVNNQPQWYVGDSNEVLKDFEPNSFEMVFSCPPYADLEVYSDLPGDISNKKYHEFVQIYAEIIEKSCRLLKSGGYAIFVVGDVRDKKTGYYYDFISDTKKAFIKAGVGLYNEAILLQPLGTAMLRATKIFSSGGKLIKVHENILIFKKP